MVLVLVALFLLPDVVPVGVVTMLSVPLIEPDVVLMVPLVLVPLVVPMVPPVLVPIPVVVSAVVPLVVRVPAVVPLVLMPKVVVWANAARLKPKKLFRKSRSLSS